MKLQNYLWFVSKLNNDLNSKKFDLLENILRGLKTLASYLLIISIHLKLFL